MRGLGGCETLPTFGFCLIIPRSGVRSSPPIPIISTTCGPRSLLSPTKCNRTFGRESNRSLPLGPFAKYLYVIRHLHADLANCIRNIAAVASTITKSS